MRWQLVIGAVVLLLPATQLSALPVHVIGELAVPAAEPNTVTVRFTATDARSPDRVLSPTLTVPGESQIDLPAGPLWRAEVEGQGLWSAPQWLRATPGQPAPTLRLRLFPAAWISATVAAPPGAPPPGRAELRFEPVPGAGPGAPPRTTVECPVSDGKLRCTVPAGSLDLRLKAGAFIPIYRFDVPVRPGATVDLGQVSLRAGASVVGWVRSGEPAVVPGGCTVDLEPKLARNRTVPAPRELEQALHRAVPTNSRGFFQFAGVAPGTYTVTASKPAFASSTEDSIVVKPDLESQLLDPLILARPVVVRVELEPSVDPYGTPWTLELTRLDPISERLGQRIRGTASPEGRWVKEGLAAGRYRLRVGGGGGSRWLDQDLEVIPGQAPLHIEIPLIQVRGRLRLGGEPLAASLWFGGSSGARRILFRADAKGRFKGWLPSEGTWPIALDSPKPFLRLPLDPVAVKRLPGASAAIVDIDVPNTRLHGIVVDEAGEPVAQAFVLTASRPPQQGGGQASAGDDGRFEIRGLPQGLAFIEASAGDRESGWQQINLPEGDDSPEVRLVARHKMKVYGRVTSKGNPIPGAFLHALPSSGGPGLAATFVDAVSGADGEFSLDLPAGTRTLDLAVAAIGLSVRLLRSDVDPKTFLDVPVDAVAGRLIVGERSRDAAGEAAFKRMFLAHSGSVWPLQAVALWLQSIGFAAPAETRDAGRTVLPEMEAGEYLLCLGGPVQDPSPAQQGGGKCASGSLGPMQELVLTLPIPPQPAKGGSRPGRR